MQRRSTNELWLAVFGDECVGKSALTLQFVRGVFVPDFDPTMEEAYRKVLNLKQDGGEGACVLSILDTAAQQEYSAMRQNYIWPWDGFLLVYSITNRSSFEHITNYRNEILQVKKKDMVPMVLVGNKTDLEEEREVATSEGWELAKRLGCGFIETSAKLRLNVEECFLQLVDECIEDTMSIGTDHSPPIFFFKRKQPDKRTNVAREFATPSTLSRGHWSLTRPKKTKQFWFQGTSRA
ncbi:Small G-protein Ras1 [Balamuthia mandrillaris]